jgi:hypothetical protein
MSHRWISLALLWAFVATAKGARPAIQIAFALQGPTLTSVINKDGKDHTEDVTRAVLQELQSKATSYFPLIEWSPAPKNPTGGHLFVKVAERRTRGPSDYFLEYWNAETNTKIQIGSSKPFIPSGDAHHPTTAASLIKRINDQIDVDLEAAATADMVTFYLCKIMLLKAPPPAPNITIVDDGVLDLPMTWDELLADGDSSLLKIKLQSQKPDHRGLSEGTLTLKNPRKQCDCHSSLVRVNVESFDYPGLILLPGQWSSAAADVLRGDRLKEFKIFVKQYKRAESTAVISK